MNSATKTIIGILILAVIVVGGALATHKKSSPMASTQSSTSTPATTKNTAPASSTTATTAATITYSSKGFEPATTTVKAGTTVTIKNTDTEEVQMDSDPHPTHTDEPELNVGSVQPGASKTFTVTKVGSWGFHNHLDPSERGQIVVQ